MKVWIVFKEFPAYDLVNDDLEIMMYDVCEIVRVFDSEDKARVYADERNKCAAELDIDVKYGCGPWEVL